MMKSIQNPATLPATLPVASVSSPQPLASIMPVHIYWFSYFGNAEPSVRYRGQYPLQQIAANTGIATTIIYPGYRPATIWRFMTTYLRLLINRPANSLIVYEKIRTGRIYGTALKVLLKISPHNTLYDIDDADYLKFPARHIQFFMRHCSRCAAGSEALVRYASAYNSNVFLLPSPVINHAFRKSVRNPLFTVGWVGYYNAHRRSLLQLLFPALLQLGFPVRLVLLGVTKPQHIQEVQHYFKDAPHVVAETPQHIDWMNEEAIYATIARFDVGVAPLLDTEVNRAKSAFKLKQYLSCGVPALASAVGENSTFLQHGSNGLVCHNAAGFAAGITHVRSMSDTDYAAMAQSAHDTCAQFSMSAYCETLLQFVSAKG